MLLSIRGFQFGKGAGKGLRSAIGILPPRSDCSIGAVAARVRADVGLIARGARRWRLTCFRCTVPPRTDSNRHASRSAGPGRERYGPGPRTGAGSVPQWVRVRVEKRTGRIRVVLASPASSLVTSTKVCSSKGPEGEHEAPARPELLEERRRYVLGRRRRADFVERSVLLPAASAVPPRGLGARVADGSNRVRAGRRTQ